MSAKLKREVQWRPCNRFRINCKQNLQDACQQCARRACQHTSSSSIYKYITFICVCLTWFCVCTMCVRDILPTTLVMSLALSVTKHVMSICLSSLPQFCVSTRQSSMMEKWLSCVAYVTNAAHMGWGGREWFGERQDVLAAGAGVFGGLQAQGGPC